MTLKIDLMMRLEQVDMMQLSSQLSVLQEQLQHTVEELDRVRNAYQDIQAAQREYLSAPNIDLERLQWCHTNVDALATQEAALLSSRDALQGDLDQLLVQLQQAEKRKEKLGEIRMAKAAERELIQQDNVWAQQEDLVLQRFGRS